MFFSEFNSSFQTQMLSFPCVNPNIETECKIETEHEMVGVVLNKLEKKLHIYLVYRPPHQSAESDESLYCNLSTIIRNKFCIVAGDFNCSVNWKTQTADAESMRLLDFANEEYLTQWVDKPTRGNNTLTLYFPLKII